MYRTFPPRGFLFKHFPYLSLLKLQLANYIPDPNAALVLVRHFPVRHFPVPQILVLQIQLSP